MVKVFGVRFHPQDKINYFEKDSSEFKKGEVAIIETELGLLAGAVSIPEREVDSGKVEINPAIEIRKATAPDLEKIRNHNEKRKEVLKACRDEVRDLKLEMKLVNVAFTLDGSKVVFYFTAESRVDFRELVKNLTQKFQKSIRLQQIGSRDVTAASGGYGLCGRELCCHKFLNEFASITTDMARLQQMAHRGSDRISGLCGRLICCLDYEAQIYDELRNSLPEIGTRVQTPKGVGLVKGKNVIKQTVDVEQSGGEMLSFKVKEVKWSK
ncbi:stage 0 sporulation protein [Patescibacteria group bacterium]|nr:stage 0 sporulation protein [Patescibacteria group bacterium]